MKRYLAVALTATLLAACNDDKEDPVSVSISPSTITLGGGDTQQFEATVANASDTSVTWEVVEAECGSIDDGGLYTAPEAEVTCHVRATSVEDDSRSATATVTVVLDVAVTITPGSGVEVLSTTEEQFNATVVNAANTAVTWSVPDENCGTISAAGLYTAPATPTAKTCHVTATSVEDATVSATVEVSVTVLALGSPTEIASFLDGKTWRMAGADIPSHPNGYNEDVNFLTSTQCYRAVEIDTNANWTTNSDLGTLEGAGGFGTLGTCNHDVSSGTLSFTSTNVLIENVSANGECFDVTATYTGFGQEGRARISPDGLTFELELFFLTQATGHRCASGAVGAGTVTLNAAAFTGNAVQVYRLVPPT